MELFPAIDLKDGQVVRLTQGDYGRATVYGTDPAAAAARFRAQGARNLHVVDLDGARDGETPNFERVRDIASGGGLFVQVGGGVRDEATIAAYLEAGVGRVILGTAAVERFEFLKEAVKRYGERIAVSVDARDGRVATRGWRQDSGLDALEFCRRLEQAGVSTIIYTDISRDGLMRGANLEAYRRLQDSVGCHIIASGGVSAREDVIALADMGLYGAIVGKALYEGTLQLKELLTLC